MQCSHRPSHTCTKHTNTQCQRGRPKNNQKKTTKNNTLFIQRESAAAFSGYLFLVKNRWQKHELFWCFICSTKFGILLFCFHRHSFIIVYLSKICTNATHFDIKKKRNSQKVNNIPVAQTKTGASVKRKKRLYSDSTHLHNVQRVFRDIKYHFLRLTLDDQTCSI